MPSTKNMQTTHISDQLRQIHAAVLDIVGQMNRPQRDELLIKAAGIPLDRALFPLLVGIERFGPIGVVEMADRVLELAFRDSNDLPESGDAGFNQDILDIGRGALNAFASDLSQRHPM